MRKALVAVTAAALVGSSGLAAAPSASASSLPRVGTESGYAVRPHRIQVGPTVGLYLRISRWQYWREHTARSVHATAYVDTCQPFCYNGREVRVHTRIYLSRVRHGHYTRMYISGRYDGRRLGTYHWTRGDWEY